MEHVRHVVLVVPAACLALGGCGPDAAPSARAGSPTARTGAGPALSLVEGMDSGSVRTRFQQLGTELPALGVVLRRRGREILGFRVSSEDAIKTWERLRALTEQSGMYPLVVRDEHGNLFEEQGDYVAAPEDTLAAAELINTDEWLAKQRELVRADREGEEGYPREPGAMAPPNSKFTVPFDIVTGQSVENVFIVLLPTTEGAQAPAWMQFGGWNECPTPEVHVAMLRRWHAKHGAEPVAMTGDVLELRVANPVRPASAAMELAKEQYLYCADIVEQGVDSVDALASVLAHGRIWFFWWD